MGSIRRLRYLGGFALRIISSTSREGGDPHLESPLVPSVEADGRPDARNVIVGRYSGQASG
jgi:hypothetical protein